MHTEVVFEYLSCQILTSRDWLKLHLHRKVFSSTFPCTRLHLQTHIVFVTHLTYYNSLKYSETLLKELQLMKKETKAANA